MSCTWFRSICSDNSSPVLFSFDFMGKKLRLCVVQTMCMSRSECECAGNYCILSEVWELFLGAKSNGFHIWLVFL